MTDIDSKLLPTIICTISFVCAELEIYVVSGLLGASPTITSRERPIRLGPDAGKHAWYIDSERVSTIELNEVVRQLFGRLKGDLSKASKEFESMKARCTVAVYIHLLSAEEPFLFLSRETIKLISLLNAEFMIDWYDERELKQSGEDED